MKQNTNINMLPLIFILLLLYLLTMSACVPSKQVSMDFTNEYLEFPATTNQVKGRVYLFHGFYGDLSYYTESWGQDLVQTLNADGYEVIGLTYPLTDISFWNDGGQEYRVKLKAYVDWAIQDVETKYGMASMNIVGGISLGGLHTIITFSDHPNKFDHWFAALPVTHLYALTEFNGVNAPYFDAFNEEQSISTKSNFLLWGTADMRVNYNYIVQLNSDLISLGSQTTSIAIPGMGHTTTQEVIDDISQWIGQL